MTPDGRLHDDYRIAYLKEHIREMLISWANDRIELIGYLILGTTDMVSASTTQMSKRYGLIYVDLNDEGKETNRRFFKDSFYWYQKLLHFGQKIPKSFLLEE